MMRFFKTYALLALVLLLSASSAMATIYFDDGGIHNINYRISDDVLVDLGTIVNLVPGGNISGHLRVRDGGRLNVSGGIVHSSLSAWGE